MKLVMFVFLRRVPREGGEPEAKLSGECRVHWTPAFAGDAVEGARLMGWLA